MAENKIETPQYIFTNPECTLGVAEFIENRFGDLVYEPTCIEKTMEIPCIDRSGEFLVVLENTIVMKKYFDAALRLCSAASVSGHMAHDKIQIYIAKTPFSPVAFRIYQGPMHVLVAPVVPDYTNELDAAIKHLEIIKKLLENK